MINDIRVYEQTGEGLKYWSLTAIVFGCVVLVAAIALFIK